MELEFSSVLVKSIITFLNKIKNFQSAPSSMVYVIADDIEAFDGEDVITPDTTEVRWLIIKKELQNFLALFRYIEKTKPKLLHEVSFPTESLLRTAEFYSSISRISSISVKALAHNITPVITSTIDLLILIRQLKSDDGLIHVSSVRLKFGTNSKTLCLVETYSECAI